MNIAEILKYCPKGTKLYCILCGNAELEEITNIGTIVIRKVADAISTSYTLDYEGRYSHSGECVLFPSKDQKDWSKFRLPVKRGDIMMITDESFPFITDGMITKDGRLGYICGVLNTSGNFQISNTKNPFWTNVFCIPASKEAKKKLFDKMTEAGYKWNADTLELEKMESIFKEGDVIKDNKNNLYLIVDTNVCPKIGCALNQDMKLTILDKVTTLASIKFTLANEKERNILYSALVRESYQYDKKQHKLVKQKFKPFDKVLIRDDINEKWSINLFSYYDEEDQAFPYVCISGRYEHCIPYEGNEYLLGTTDSPT